MTRLDWSGQLFLVWITASLQEPIMEARREIVNKEAITNFKLLSELLRCWGQKYFVFLFSWRDEYFILKVSVNQITNKFAFDRIHMCINVFSIDRRKSFPYADWYDDETNGCSFQKIRLGLDDLRERFEVDWICINVEFAFQWSDDSPRSVSRASI